MEMWIHKAEQGVKQLVAEIKRLETENEKLRRRVYLATRPEPTEEQRELDKLLGQDWCECCGDQPCQEQDKGEHLNSLEQRIDNLESFAMKFAKEKRDEDQRTTGEITEIFATQRNLIVAQRGQIEELEHRISLLDSDFAAHRAKTEDRLNQQWKRGDEHFKRMDGLESRINDQKRFREEHAERLNHHVKRMNEIETIMLRIEKRVDLHAELHGKKKKKATPKKKTTRARRK